MDSNSPARPFDRLPPTDQRVAILVDSENLEISVDRHFEPPAGQKTTHRAYPDWMTIIPRVLAGRTLTRSIYYKKRGKRISARFAKLWQTQLNGEVKQPRKSVDPYIIIDAITVAHKVDTIILLAGDKDYLPLIWFLKSQGCRVEMAAFEDAAATEIKYAADYFFLLDEEDTVVLKKYEAEPV